MSFVLDNSVVMCWLLPSAKATDIAYAASVLDSLKESQAFVPSLWALEVANVIARAENKGVLTEARSQAFIALLNRLNITEDKATAKQALSETLNLARRYKLSSYDAAYLELALRTENTLATLDGDMIKAAKKSGVSVFLLGSVDE